MTAKKSVLIATLVAALVAVLFPPWGFLGNSFDHFGFAFRPRPDFQDIMWQLLGLELAAIALLGGIAYVLAKP